jgi:hypothetical protein
VAGFYRIIGSRVVQPDTLCVTRSSLVIPGFAFLFDSQADHRWTAGIIFALPRASMNTRVATVPGKMARVG